jgi:hypothetical protein
MQIFSRNPKRLCTEIIIQDPDQVIVWHYLVQDTPGYGDIVDHADLTLCRAAITSYIRRCNERYQAQEEEPNRKLPLQVH